MSTGIDQPVDRPALAYPSAETPYGTTDPHHRRQATSQKLDVPPTKTVDCFATKIQSNSLATGAGFLVAILVTDRCPLTVDDYLLTTAAVAALRYQTGLTVTRRLCEIQRRGLFLTCRYKLPPDKQKPLPFLAGKARNPPMLRHQQARHRHHHCPGCKFLIATLRPRLLISHRQEPAK